MMKFAVLGDSIVKRQGEEKFIFEDVEVRFFGVGGMRLSTVEESLWKRVEEYQPSAILLHLGGNDINNSTNPAQLHQLFMRHLLRLRNTGIRVYVAEVMPRLSVRDISLELFEKIRKGLNSKLRRTLGKDFVFLHVDARSAYLSSDGVHLSYRGRVQYHRVLQRLFAK